MADLDTKIEQARRRLQDLQAQARKAKRKEDTRRKVIYGVALFALLQELPVDKRQATINRLHQKITKASDRAFLGLPPLQVAGNTKSTADQ